MVGVFPRIPFNQRHSDRGRGVPPPPRQPHPHGGDIPSTQFQGRDPLPAVSVNTLLKSCLRPRALYPDYRHALPAPSEGGGRRRGTRRAAGVVYLTRKKSVWLTRNDRGGGCSTPLPVSPSPTGRFSIDTVLWRRSSLCRQCEHPAEILSLSPCTVSGLSPRTARPLGRGREEARNAPGGGGVFQMFKNCVTVRDRGQGGVSPAAGQSRCSLIQLS